MSHACAVSPAPLPPTPNHPLLQTVLGAFLPISLLAALFPSRISCRAYELPASTLYNRQADNSGAVFTPAAVRIKAQHAAQQQPLTTLLSQARGAISVALAQLATELAILLRGIYLTALFSPMLLMSPLVFNYDIGRAQWLLLLRWTLEKAGPAFIKWGQWGSTRPDLFPRDVCAALEALQSNAPSHAAPLSVAMVEAAFNRPLRELFSAWEAQPIASGSIAQIHRARLSPQAAASCGVAPGTLVAVKVRHPGVERLMAQDFILMDRAARLAGYLPGLKSLRLDESVRQFGGPLQEQLDLSVEAQHLSKFARNFRSWRNVKFPVSLGVQAVYVVCCGQCAGSMYCRPCAHLQQGVCHQQPVLCRHKYSMQYFSVDYLQPFAAVVNLSWSGATPPLLTALLLLFSPVFAVALRRRPSTPWCAPVCWWRALSQAQPSRATLQPQLLLPHAQQ